MPRAEKSTKELKVEFEKVREKYEQSLAKDNKKVADLVHKYYGEELDLPLLDEHFKKVSAYYLSMTQQSKDAGTHTGVKKVGDTGEQSRSSD